MMSVRQRSATPPFNPVIPDCPKLILAIGPLNYVSYRLESRLFDVKEMSDAGLTFAAPIRRAWCALLFYDKVKRAAHRKPV